MDLLNMKMEEKLYAHVRKEMKSALSSAAQQEVNFIFQSSKGILNAAEK